MKKNASLLRISLGLFAVLTLLCGLLYPAVVTGFAQGAFPHKANGSLIRVDGKVYGSALLGQRFTKPGYLWGRPTDVNVELFHDKQGRPLYYAQASNLSPASEKYGKLIAERVKQLRETNPERGDSPIPVDLVTGSASGLDPDISPAAAEYQVPRIAKARGISEEQVREVIASCTEGRFLGIFGEPRVNVLKVNLKLDGVLK